MNAPARFHYRTYFVYLFVIVGLLLSEVRYIYPQSIAGALRARRLPRTLFGESQFVADDELLARLERLDPGIDR